MKAIFFCFLLLIMLPQYVFGQEVAVIYPRVKQTFQAVFLDIVRGIDSGTSSPIVKHIMEEDFTEKDMQEWIESNKNKVLIVLGSKGLRLSSAHKVKEPLLISAVVSIPSNLIEFAKQQVIVSLAPHPKRLFEELHRLSPNIKRVFTVYSKIYSQQLIKQAEESAQKFGLTLVAYQAKDLQESAQRYKKIFQQAKPNEDSIWILQDQLTINNDVILPELLKLAWQKNLILFSSRFSDVKRGALFSLYPNNYALGKQLALMAKEISKGQYQRGEVSFLEDVHTAFNIRTAQHIDLNVSSTGQERFKLIFPSN